MYLKLHQLLKSSGMVLCSQIVVSAGNFITFLILARIMGLTSFGLFSTLWLVVLFTTSVLMALSIFPMMTNYLKIDALKRELFLEGTIIYSVAILFILGLLCLLLLLTLNLSEVMPLIVCIVLVNFQDLVRRLYIVSDRARLALISDLITYGSRIAALLLLQDSFDLDVASSLWVVGFSSFLGIIFVIKGVSYFKFYRSSAIMAWNINSQSAKWLFPAGLMQWTSVNLFISMAAYLISPAAVGVIRICQSILAVFNVLIQAAENIIPVRAVSTLNSGGIKKLFVYSARVGLFGSAPFALLSLICFVFGETVVVAIYGDKYLGMIGNTLFIYSIAYVFVYLIVPVRAVLRATENTKVWFDAYIAASIFSVASVYWLEDNFNVTGAVFGILIAHIILIGYSLIAMAIKFKKGVL